MDGGIDGWMDSLLNNARGNNASPLEPGASTARLMAYVLRHLSNVSSHKATIPSFPPVTKPLVTIHSHYISEIFKGIVTQSYFLFEAKSDTFSRACMLKTGPSWALTVFTRNMSLQMQMSPVQVPENTISSVQPYTVHIIVSVFPMLPFFPISPPPENSKGLWGDTHILHKTST